MKAYMIYETVQDYWDDSYENAMAYYFSKEKAERAIRIIEEIRMANYLRRTPNSKGIAARKDGRFRMQMKEITIR